jgi:hypothetical protein
LFVESAYSQLVIALPPVPPDDHVQSTVLSVSVSVNTGALGIVNAVMEPEGVETLEDIPEPDCFTTVKVYAVPTASTPDEKDIGETEALDVNPVGLEVAT